MIKLFFKKKDKKKKKLKFKLGDKVITHQGEHGVIASFCSDWMPYDYWVNIEFVSKGHKYVSKVFYREGELKSE